MNIATKLRELADEIESQDTPDIRPIGELPVGTEIRYIEGEKAGIPFGWHKAMTQKVRYVGPNNTCRSTPEGGTRSNLPPHHRVRVIAYPGGYQDGTPEPNEDVVRTLESAGCVDPETTRFLVIPKLVGGRSARSVIDELKKSKPHLFQKPEPTALEQLPEAVRDQMRSFGDLAVLCGLRRETADDIFEALARVILDNAAEIFAAGEPVHGMCINGKSRNKIATALSIGNRSVWTGLQGSDAVFGDVNFVKECRPNGTGLHLSAPNALAFARRTVAIALAARKNAQEDAS